MSFHGILIANPRTPESEIRNPKSGVRSPRVARAHITFFTLACWEAKQQTIGLDSVQTRYEHSIILISMYGGFQYMRLISYAFCDISMCLLFCHTEWSAYGDRRTCFGFLYYLKLRTKREPTCSRFCRSRSDKRGRHNCHIMKYHQSTTSTLTQSTSLRFP